jgi:hypothetical protein
MFLGRIAEYASTLIYPRFTRCIVKKYFIFPFKTIVTQLLAGAEFVMEALC